jgi:hypothetical protein
VDVAHCLLEIEILVFLLRGHANITAGGETPVGRYDFLAVHQLDQPRHSLQLGLGKAVLQPHHLSMKISGVLELLHSSLALLIELLHKLGRSATVIGSGNGIVCHELGTQVPDA